jgi:hypothetical protein
MAFLVVLGQPLTAKTPIIEYQETDKLIMISGNSLIAISEPYFSALPCLERGDCTPDDYKHYIQEKYPKNVCLLSCLLREESHYCHPDWMIGDSGKAFGCYQIWISEHPVSKECAMDFVCALRYTASQIEIGKGSLWTPYYRCLGECNR